MKLIIDIPDEAYEKLKSKSTLDNIAESIIANGTPYNPSGDRISREALKEAIQKCEEEPNYQHDGETWQNGLYMAETLIDNAPKVEITEEQAIDKLHETGWLIEHDKEMATRPQGKWELHGMIYYCSECGHDCGESGDNFCGNCGADMRGGAE